MAKLEQDFKEFIELLNKNGVEYMVIGGYAINFYCRPSEPVRIDIVNDIPEVDFYEAYSRQVIADIDKVQIQFISLQDLKINKTAAGKTKI